MLVTIAGSLQRSRTRSAGVTSCRIASPVESRPGDVKITSDTLKCRVPRSALWRRGPLWQIPNIVCWGLGDFDFEVLG